MKARDQIGSKTVLVWKSHLLPYSETFVRYQSEAVPGWRTVYGGLTATTGQLETPNDCVIFGSGLIGKLRLRAFRLTRVSAAVTRTIKKIQPDLVHVHFATDAALIAPTLKRLHIPFVITLHGYDVTVNEGSSVSRSIRARRLAGAFGSATRLLAVSEPIRLAAIRRGAPTGKLEVQHLGLPTSTELSQGDGFSRRSGVLFVGRLVEKKGPLLFLTALATIPHSKRPPATVVGEGTLREQAEIFAKEHSLEVVFMGSQTGHAVRDLMRKSRLLISSSVVAENGDMEGLPIVLLEAASVGLPVVAFDHSGVSEGVEHDKSGLLVEEGDVLALATAIQKAYFDEKLWAELNRGSMQMLSTRFEPAAIRDSLAVIYGQVLLNGSSPSGKEFNDDVE